MAGSTPVGVPAGLRIPPRSGETSPALVGAITLLALVVCAALVFVTLEAPRWLARAARDAVGIPDLHPAIEPEAIEAFLATSPVRPLGYACLVLVLIFIVAGLVARRASVSSVGAVLLFLPTLGAFAGYMFFLAGLGVLRALWLPAWADWISLGDVVYLPYIAVVAPLWIAGYDVREWVAVAAIGLGLLVFVGSTAAWLLARATGRPVADAGLYRVSRHPQYLGWLIWSWGFMVLSAIQPVPMAGVNPGASLPWVVGSLAIVAVAWVEEARMRQEHGPAYEAYRGQAPFLLPLPGPLRRAAGAPIRGVLGRAVPASGRDAVAAWLVGLGLVIVASLPFFLADWPPGGWWAWPDWSLVKP